MFQEWEGLDNIPKKGGALIIYYHGVSTNCSLLKGHLKVHKLKGCDCEGDVIDTCRLACQLTIVPQLGRSGLKKADVFPVLLIGYSHSFP